MAVATVQWQSAGGWLLLRIGSLSPAADLVVRYQVKVRIKLVRIVIKIMMVDVPCRVRIVCFLLLCCLTQTTMAGNGLGTLGSTIVGSKHDLSISNYYGDGSSFGVTPSDQICVFCHTPHNANIDLNNDAADDPDDAVRAPAPLWNRNITVTNLSASFKPYGSSPGYQSYTLNTVFDGSWVPSPVSLVCLSCHDSALASGDSGIVTTAGEFGDTHNLVNMPNRAGADTPNCEACHPDGGVPPPDWWQIGPDMSDDHPISMPYPPTYLGWANDFNPAANAATGWADIKLYYGRVECPSCHNPHNPGEIVYIDPGTGGSPDVKYAPFLRKTLDGSSLCITCHKL